VHINILKKIGLHLFASRQNMLLHVLYDLAAAKRQDHSEKQNKNLSEMYCERSQNFYD
jgi:hypothetical protein